MPDLLDFAITPLGASNVNVPRAQIEARIVDSATQQTLIADFTGPNAIIFPAVIADLTPAQRQALARLVATWLVRTRAGLEPGL